MITTEEFKQKARNIHKDLYNYDKSFYKCARTNFELFEATMVREKIIKDKGYKIVSIWENDFDKTIVDI